MIPNNILYRRILQALDTETEYARFYSSLYYMKRIAMQYGAVYTGCNCSNKYLKDWAELIGVELDGEHHTNNWYLRRIALKISGQSELEHNTDNYCLTLILENITPPTPVEYDNIVISSDKPILSYADSESATLTAQLMNGDVSASISDVTVQFYKYVDGTNDVLLGSDVTDANGEATYTYSSTGSGDVGLYVKVRTLVSETFGVQDCMFYDASSSVNLGKYSAQSGASFSYDSNKNAYNASPSTAGPQFVNLNNLTFSKDNAVSFDFNMVSTNNNAQIGFVIGNIGVRAIHAGSTQRITISNSAYSSDYTYKDNTINLNTWYTLELLPTGVLNLKQGDTIIATCNYDISSIQTDTNSFKIYTAYTIPTTNTVRNIKVKPL